MSSPTQRDTDMSGQEKSMQIGDAMLLLNEQKQELAHVKEKITKVAHAYGAFARETGRWRVDPTDPHKVFLLNPNREERDLPTSLLSEPQLAELIAEHSQAQAELAKTTAKLAGFGIVL